MITDRVGIELEVEDIPQDSLPRGNMWNITHDASTERNRLVRMKINNSYNLVYNNAITREASRNVLLGGELVSKNNLTYGEGQKEYLEKELDRTIAALIEAGESPYSYRGSTHFHVNFPIWDLDSDDGLHILRRAAILGANLEELFFHIGGMGYKYRGVIINNSAYCRPITGKGPQVVLCNNGGRVENVQVFILDDLLKARNMTEWWKRVGNTPREPGSVNRYHPARYTWLNLYSPILRGTLEFRVFNKSLSRMLITSALKLCQEFTYAVYSNNLTNYDLEENSIYDSTGNEQSHKLLNDFLSNLKKVVYLDNTSVKLLHLLIEKSTLLGSEFGNQYVFTHLRRYDRNSGNIIYSRREGSYCPPAIEERVLDSSFVDIHNLYSTGG